MTPEQRREQERLATVMAFHQCFSTPAGQKVLQKLSKFCLEQETTFVENPLMTAYREGARTVILEIRKHLAASPGSEPQKVAQNTQEER